MIEVRVELSSNFIVKDVIFFFCLLLMFLIELMMILIVLKLVKFIK